MFVRTQANGSRTYPPIVDTVRVDGKVQVRVLRRLGRLIGLLASGQLDSLLQSLGRFSGKLAILGAHARGDRIAIRSARIGPVQILPFKPDTRDTRHGQPFRRVMCNNGGVRSPVRAVAQPG